MVDVARRGHQGPHTHFDRPHHLDDPFASIDQRVDSVAGTDLGRWLRRVPIDANVSAPSHSWVAIGRVLTRRTAHSHRSMRVSSVAPLSVTRRLWPIAGHGSRARVGRYISTSGSTPARLRIHCQVPRTSATICRARSTLTPRTATSSCSRSAPDDPRGSRLRLQYHDSRFLDRRRAAWDP